MIHDALFYFSFRIKQSSNTIEFGQVITVRWKTWSTECRKCGMWKMRSVENAECRKYIKEKDYIYTCIKNSVSLG